MRASDVMSVNLVTIRSDATVRQAVGLMLERRLSGLPVVDADNDLVGIVTEGDLLHRTEIGTERRRPRWLEFLLGSGVMAEDYVAANARHVSEIMTRDVVTAASDAALPALVELMDRHRIKRIPIVQDRKLIGIVSRADLLRALKGALAPDWPQPFRSDEDVLSEIRAELDRTACIPKASIEASVRDGIVELRGSITDQRERAAIRVAVANVRGVRAIHDHILWVDPLTGIFEVSPEDMDAARA